MTIAHEGMPVHNFPSTKGAMEITFTIQFPKSLTDEQKKGMCVYFTFPAKFPSAFLTWVVFVGVLHSIDASAVELSVRIGTRGYGREGSWHILKLL